MCGNVKNVQEAIDLLKSGRTLTGRCFTYFRYNEEKDIFIEYFPADCDLITVSTSDFDEDAFRKHIEPMIGEIKYNYEDD